jgi:hypothetical protein
MVASASDGVSVNSFMSLAKDRLPGLDAHVIHEQPLESLLLMTLCQHHVIIDSTLGFWGMMKVRFDAFHEYGC